MKSFFLPLFVLLFALPSFLFSQSTEQLNDWNQRRIQIQERQMYVLGGWAAGNMVYSGIRLGQTEGERRSFHQMNVAWNAVNLTIAGLAYYGSRRERKKEFSLTETLRAQSGVEKTLLFNTGLDVGYMAFGLYLMERGNNTAELERSQQLTGWGQSLILQGGFLFTYDLIFAIIQSRHGNQGVMRWLDNVQPVGLGLGINIPLG